jgi:hypothetical protein
VDRRLYDHDKVFNAFSDMSELHWLTTANCPQILGISDAWYRGR